MSTSVIVGLLVIAAVWAVYLLPTVFGERRDAPMNSTEKFDRWTHSMANVQKHTAAQLAASNRDLIHQRRRRTLALLVFLAAGSFGAAWFFNALPWMLVGFFFGSLIVLYLALLAQMRQRRMARLKVTHVAERPSEWDEAKIRVIGN